MARKKVALQWIANDASRRAAFKKRCKGLMKKADELTTLCKAKTCVVVYGEDEANPAVYPSAAEAVLILSRFKAMPSPDQFNKTTNHEDFLRQRIDKLQEYMQRSNSENRDRSTMTLLQEALLRHRPVLDNVTAEELTCLGLLVGKLLKNAPEPEQDGAGDLNRHW